MNPAVLETVDRKPFLLDGGLGTELMRRGLAQGVIPESWNFDRPEAVKSVHESYIAAGSDAVTTNTFGANRIKLRGSGLENRVRDLNLAGARIAREAVPAGKFVGGCLGPTGKFLVPQGEFTESEFEDVFAEQAEALAAGGVDFLIIETQYDLAEALAALRGACRAAALPVFVTMTFNKFPRGYFTLMGNTVVQCAETLERTGAAAVGANCTLNSEEIIGAVRLFREATRLPVIAQANAGRPSIDGNGRVTYAQSVEEYVRFVPDILAAGAKILGGCCGTEPATIRRMAEVLRRGPSRE
jgi:5-methyltetrahydrofolate--homocysteine methyltransferase